MNSLYDLIKDDDKLGKDKRSLDEDDNSNVGNENDIPTNENQKTIADLITCLKDILIGINKLNENQKTESANFRNGLSGIKKSIDNLENSISVFEKRIIEKIPEEIETLIGNGKITAELDKRSKTFITAGGIASFVFAILVIIMGIWGNKYVQDANKYENLMAVFDVMPKDQYDQIQTWVQTSYQNINHSKNDTPIPSK